MVVNHDMAQESVMSETLVEWEGGGGIAWGRISDSIIIQRDKNRSRFRQYRL